MAASGAQKRYNSQMTRANVTNMRLNSFVDRLKRHEEIPMKRGSMTNNDSKEQEDKFNPQDSAKRVKLPALNSTQGITEDISDTGHTFSNKNKFIKYRSQVNGEMNYVSHGSPDVCAE